MSGANESPPPSWFEAVFENAPVAIWYEDFSELKNYLDGLRSAGVEDVAAHLEKTPDAVYECLRRVRVCHVNRLAREFYGAGDSDQMSESLPSLFDDAALETFRDELAAFCGGARSFSAEIEAATLRGGRRLVQMNVSILRTQGDDWSRVVVAFTDLTERRELERSLQRANEALQRSNAELEQFAYAAAHELKEPLRTVAMFARLLERTAPAAAGTDAEQAIAQILDGTERMRTLIADLLSFAKALEAAPGGAEPLCDLRSVADETIASLRAAAAEAGAEIEVGDLPEVAMNAAELRHVLQNLISNALKYRAPGRAPRVRITSDESASETRICVADNGPGIPKRYHEQIFRLFKRLHGREVPGTGIGLALCKRIVEHNGGRIWVESAEDAGARFYFSIPRR